MIEIKMFPASYGDSFLVSCTGVNKTNIIIDMGFSSTYNKYISPELEKIKDEGISLLIFTHIDADHILGGIQFLKKNENKDITQPIDVKEIWYNSYKHLQFNKDKEKQSSPEVMFEGINEILKKGHPREVGAREVSDIGYEQGSTLASLILKNGYADRWNKTFDYKAVVVSEVGQNTYQINDEVLLTILSPSINKLELLGRKWGEKLSSMGYEDSVNSNQVMDDAFEIYMSNLQMESKQRSVESISSYGEEIEKIVNEEFEPDTSEINGSSIAFILEFREKKVLFLGDCHSDIIEENFKKILEETKQEKIWFDAVKISHHGSKYNTGTNLLKLIRSDKYIFSTNGRGKNFSHPHIETIYRIITTDNTKDKKLIFNYKPFKIFNDINDIRLKEKYSYQIEYTNDLELSEEQRLTSIHIS